MSKTLLFAISFLFPVATWSIPITFDLKTLITEANDDVTSLSLTQDGLTATLSANTGVINRSSSAVGINSSGGCDNSDELDSACPNTPSERLTVSFDESVILQNFAVKGLSGGDSGELVIGEDSSNFRFSFSTTGLFEPVSSTTLLITAGETFYVASVTDNKTSSGRGFSFNSFTVERIPEVVKVTEPSMLFLVLIGAVMFLQRLRLSLVRKSLCCYFVGFVVRPVK